MKYLLIFDDGNISQTDELADGDDESVRGGYLEVIRFNADIARFERWCPGEDCEWTEV
jgi:hypothetical protein